MPDRNFLSGIGASQCCPAVSSRRGQVWTNSPRRNVRKCDDRDSLLSDKVSFR